MIGWIILLIIIIGAVVYALYSSSKTKKQNEEANKRKVEAIKQKESSFKAKYPNAKIIVNDGTNFFFMDDTKQVYGKSEDGPVYKYDNVSSLGKFPKCFTITDMTFKQFPAGFLPNYTNITIGQNYDTPSIPALSASDNNDIYHAMMPILRRNLYKVLEENGVVPSHEYENQGDIWGCDLNSRKFYTTFTRPEVHDFEDLIDVRVENYDNSPLIDTKRIIQVQIDLGDGMDTEMSIMFFSPDSTFHNILKMFKGIKNRQRGI